MRLTVGQPILAAAGFQPALRGSKTRACPKEPSEKAAAGKIACPTKLAELRPHYTRSSRQYPKKPDLESCGSALLFLRRIQKRSFIQLLERLPKLLLRVHHNRAVPGDGLFKRLAGAEQETDAIFAGFDGHFVAAIKDHQRTVVGEDGIRFL